MWMKPAKAHNGELGRDRNSSSRASDGRLAAGVNEPGGAGDGGFRYPGFDRVGVVAGAPGNTGVRSGAAGGVVGLNPGRGRGDAESRRAVAYRGASVVLAAEDPLSHRRRPDDGEQRHQDR
jgi:hypothetical protein